MTVRSILNAKGHQIMSVASDAKLVAAVLAEIKAPKVYIVN